MLVFTRTAQTLSYADDIDPAAADVATLGGNAAALANDLFVKDGSSSSRTWTDLYHARRTQTHSCRACTRCSSIWCEVYTQLGPLNFRRANRMKFSSFKRLTNDLC